MYIYIYIHRSSFSILFPTIVLDLLKETPKKIHIFPKYFPQSCWISEKINRPRSSQGASMHQPQVWQCLTCQFDLRNRDEPWALGLGTHI